MSADRPRPVAGAPIPGPPLLSPAVLSPATAAAVRVVGPPVSAAILLICVLTSWVASGGFGTVARVRIDVVSATVPVPATPGLTAAYLTIRNNGDEADELLSVTTPSAGQTMLAENSATGASGAMTRLSGIEVPAHGSADLGPFGTDIMLMDARPLHVGQTVTLVLDFREAGEVTVQATVTPPGTA
jgi:copper(I)-binding protein